MVKSLPTMQETWVQSLGWEEPLEKEMIIYSRTIAWKIPWTEEPGRLQSMGSLRIGQDWVNSLSLFTFMHWRRKWQSTLGLLPGKSHGQRSLVGYSPRGHKESDTTEQHHFTSLNMPANLENSAVATGLEKVSFHYNPKERQCQRMLKLPAQLHSSHTLAKQCSKFSKPGFSNMLTMNFRCSSWF